MQPKEDTELWQFLEQAVLQQGLQIPIELTASPLYELGILDPRPMRSWERWELPGATAGEQLMQRLKVGEPLREPLTMAIWRCSTFRRSELY